MGFIVVCFAVFINILYVDPVESSPILRALSTESGHNGGGNVVVSLLPEKLDENLQLYPPQNQHVSAENKPEPIKEVAFQP